MAQLNKSDPLKLAIDGGPPAITQPPPAWPIADAAIHHAIARALDDSSWGTYHGPWLDQLEAQLRRTFDVSHVTCCSSGTVAVELALRGVGVKENDEVILAGYDFPGNFRAIEAIGAIPVLTDVVADGWVMDFEAIETAVSDKTVAVLVSHLHGQIADIPALRQRMEELGRGQIQIVEDVCQTPGGAIGGQPLGSFGDASTLSFGGSKLLSAGRGGAVLTNDAKIAQRIKIANDRGNEAYPLSQLQAIVLGPQIDQLESMNAQRNRNAHRLLQSIEPMTTLSGMSQQVTGKTVTPAFFKLPVILKRGRWARERWLYAAQTEGLPVGSGFRGFTKRSSRRCRKTSTLENCRIAAEQTVLLHHPILRSDDQTIEQIEQALRKLEITISSETENE